MMTRKHMWRYMYIYIYIRDINTFKVFITHHECNINTNVSFWINKLQYTHRYNVVKSFIINIFNYIWYNFSHRLMYVFKIIYQRVCVHDALAWHDNYFIGIKFENWMFSPSTWQSNLLLPTESTFMYIGGAVLHHQRWSFDQVQNILFYSYGYRTRKSSCLFKDKLTTLWIDA